MTTSLATIRQSLALLVPGALVGTASSESSASELWDTNWEMVTFGADGAQDFTGYWIVRSSAVAAGDRVRRVAFHDQGLGRIKPSRVWTNSPASETYELWPPDFRPTLVDQAINDGLARLTYRVEGSITPVANDNAYALSSLTWITGERDVREVWKRYTSSNYQEDQPWGWWRVLDNAGTFTLVLDPMPHSTTGITIVVEGVAKYGTLSSDSATTAAPSDWVVAAAKVELYRKITSDAKNQGAAGWGADYIEARREFNRLSKLYAPRVPRRSPLWRSPTRMPFPGQTRTVYV